MYIKSVFNVVVARIFFVNSKSLFKLCLILCCRYRDFMKDCPTGELKQEVYFSVIIICELQNMSSKCT